MARSRSASPCEIFLSHSSQDRGFATRLAKELRGHGLSVWYSATHIRGAQQWHDKIGDALARCNWFVVVLSRASVRSTWVKRELLFALNHQQYEDRIIPALRAPCDWSRLSWTLETIQLVDFTKSFAQGFEEILRICRPSRKHRKSPSRREPR